MKKVMKKLLAVVAAMTMVLAMAIPAMAQTVPENATQSADKASITITNASKGVTYSVYKLFDASVTGTKDGSIAYTGDIPQNLSAYFTKDSAGNISATAALDFTSETVQAAFKSWASSQTAAGSVESDGSELTFANLDYGYYVVTTTQGETAITVTSTNPDASIVDKNTTTEVGGLKKTAKEADVSIGDTVTYEVEFTTANFTGQGTSAKQIISYTITDTLPDFLDDVEVTKITIGGTEYKVNDEVPQFDSNKQITIPWAATSEDEDGNTVYGASLYDNGAKIVVTYTATVTDEMTIEGSGNKNEVTITYTDKDGNTSDGTEETDKTSSTIYTYAAALQKIDENKKPLAGAKFAANGLTVTGSNGVYTVVSYDPTSTTQGTEMETDAQGQLVILGLASNVTLTVTETAAPAGYNKLTDTASLSPVKTGEEITATEKTIYYDADGKVTDEQTSTSYTKTTYNVSLLKQATQVVNEKGATLPSTGGMGTTIFYVLGAILVIGAGVVLVSRRRVV